MGIDTKNPTLLAEQAKRMAGNLANDLTMLRNLSTTLGAKARALELDPDDSKLAGQVESLMDRVSAAYLAAKPDNPRFDSAVASASRSGENAPSAHSELVQSLHAAGMDRELALLEELLACPHSQAGIAFDEYGGPVLEMPCAGGKLTASYMGDPGIYDGIDIDFVAHDGSARQCALVEFDHGANAMLTHTCDGTSVEASGYGTVDLTCPDGAWSAPMDGTC